MHLKEIHIIEKKHSNASQDTEQYSAISEDIKRSKGGNPMPETLSDLMRPKSKVEKDGREEYSKKHRHHFNRKLSEYAVSQLLFVDPGVKMIAYDRCLDLMKGNSIKLPDEATEGDLHYVVNKIRAEHSLETVKTDIHALKLAIECLENPNIEEGEVFMQWLEHMYRIKKDIIWEKFIEN